MSKQSNIEYYRDTLGFDLSVSEEYGCTIRRSQCEAPVINGVPTHETGCPNATQECKGCEDCL